MPYIHSDRNAQHIMYEAPQTEGLEGNLMPYTPHITDRWSRHTPHHIRRRPIGRILMCPTHSTKWLNPTSPTSQQPPLQPIGCPYTPHINIRSILPDTPIPYYNRQVVQTPPHQYTKYIARHPHILKVGLLDYFNDREVYLSWVKNRKRFTTFCISQNWHVKLTHIPLPDFITHEALNSGYYNI